MVLALANKDADIVPGYTLRERIGAGGYGEVWKADAPGGLTKAVKLVYGYLDEERAACELKALSRIKEVRHPFLLSLERIEVINSQLVIITELAEASLKDRYEQCRARGEPGIPRAELLACLRDAADALDYMGERFSLQHLDIKPENLLLIGGRVKVADFGLVKDLHEGTLSLMGGLTPVYAAPEVFTGHPSAHSDQYSLAIVYQELLTSVLPFPGRNLGQLATQHQQSSPRLVPLPPDDRAVIARALAKNPSDRFPTCRAMIDSLLGWWIPAYPRGPAGLDRPQGEEAVGDTASAAQLSDTSIKTPPACAKQAPADAGAESGRTVPIDELPLPTGLSWTSALLAERGPRHDRSESGPRTVAGLPPAPSCRDAAGGNAAPAGVNRAAQTTPDWPLPMREAVPTVEDLPPVEMAAEQLRLRPTLVIGIGGTAARTLRHLRLRWSARFAQTAAARAFRMLLIDTDRRALTEAARGDVPGALEPGEMLAVPVRRAEEYRDEWETHLRWLNRRWLCNIPRSLQTEGLRPLGRLAMLDHAPALLARLHAAITETATAGAAAGLTQATGPTACARPPRVIVVASISGGTGSGMLMDVAYAVRQVLAELSLPEASVSGVLVHSVRRGPGERLLAAANACACLREMRHCAVSGYPGAEDYGLPGAGDVSAFDDTCVVHLGDGLGLSGFENQTGSLAEYLNLVTATAGGVLLEKCRAAWETHAPLPPPERPVRTFGLCLVGELLADATARISDFLGRANPHLNACGGARRLLLVCPDESTAATLRSRMSRELKTPPSVAIDPYGEPLLCCEVAGMPLTQVAGRLIEGRSECAEIASKLHTRVDVAW